MKTLLQIGATGLAALVLGFAWNQANPRGIPWRLFHTQAKSCFGEAPRSMDMNDAFLRSLDGDIRFLDIRPESEFNLDHIPQAVSTPWLKLVRTPQALDSLAMNDAYVIYAFSAENSSPKIVATLMKERGFEDIYILDGGFAHWINMELPLELGVDG